MGKKSKKGKSKGQSGNVMPGKKMPMHTEEMDNMMKSTGADSMMMSKKMSKA